MKPRVAASSYLNTAPLVWTFKHGPRAHDIELLEAVPARCADMLEKGEADIALVPAIEYQRNQSVSVVPGIAVASRESVRSVVLASKRSLLSEIRRVALDESSRTSAALIKIIFREFVHGEPEWISSAPDLQTMLADNDAALLIGDPAMTFSREGLHVFDMASLWRKYTGLGFVFALWMFTTDAADAVTALDLPGACREGLARKSEIIDYYQPLLGLPRSELEIYLSQNITFHLDDEFIAGLNLFYNLAYKHKLTRGMRALNL